MHEGFCEVYPVWNPVLLTANALKLHGGSGPIQVVLHENCIQRKMRKYGISQNKKAVTVEQNALIQVDH